MSKLVFVVFICLFGASISLKIDQSVLKNLRFLEDKINQTVECVRTTLTTGIPELGLPSFDPLIIENFTLNLDNLNLTDVKGFATLENGVADNIVNFVVTNVKGELYLLPPTYTVDFTMLNANLSNLGHYRLNLTAFGVPIWGEGSILVGIEHLNITGHVKGVIDTDMVVVVKELAAPATIEKFIFSITGLFGDEDYSKEISQKISEAVPEIINNNPEIFLDIVGPLIVELMNALINDEIGVGIIKQMVKTCIIDVLFPPY
ncbi:uncharacterized protein LOC109594145 [Aethina tumida]|uniref:uncharacterized protein LOC109594145 n=1 Tax=Aethina tumida TaxID=116153 RepID=UPI00096B2543|nr:uncharacterized protein LOC109594145 [Aethina tumida]